MREGKGERRKEKTKEGHFPGLNCDEKTWFDSLSRDKKCLFHVLFSNFLLNKGK